MSYIQTRNLTVGEALSGTFEELGYIKRPIAVYFGIFAALSAFELAAENFFPGANVLIPILMTVLYFFAQYRLYQLLLDHHGLLEDDSLRIASFFGMALVIGIALGFASNFLLLPAIILGARWIIAPTYLVAGHGKGVFTAMGESWDTTSGSTLALSLAYFAIWFVWLFILGAAGNAEESLDLPSASNPLVAITMHLLPVTLMGLSVAAYRILNETEETLTNVFE